MLANYLIGLREGLEAALVVTILIAYLVKSGRREHLRHIWTGVAVAVAASLLVGATLSFSSRSMTFEQQEIFGGTLSIVAVGFVTWMVLWMRRAARTLATDLRSRLDDALSVGPAAITVTAMLAVGREGLETALFLWAAVQATGNGWTPLLGGALGLLTAVALGYALYRGAIRLDLSRFFTWTGAALIVVAAGVLAYGVHDLQEARVLPGLNHLAFDVSEQIPPSSWYAALLKGTLNFSPATTWLEAIAWVCYVSVMSWLFWRGGGRRHHARAAPQPETSAA